MEAVMWQLHERERRSTAHLLLGLREELQDLGVVVDGLVEAIMVGLHHVIHQLLYSLPLRTQLRTSHTAQRHMHTSCGCPVRLQGSTRVTKTFI